MVLQYQPKKTLGKTLCRSASFAFSIWMDGHLFSSNSPTERRFAPLETRNVNAFVDCSELVSREESTLTDLVAKKNACSSPSSQFCNGTLPLSAPNDVDFTPKRQV